jgi:hypothetical protein
VQTFEDSEDPFVIFGRNANPVVCYRQQAAFFTSSR